MDAGNVLFFCCIPKGLLDNASVHNHAAFSALVLCAMGTLCSHITWLCPVRSCGIKMHKGFLVGGNGAELTDACNSAVAAVCRSCMRSGMPCWELSCSWSSPCSWQNPFPP